MTECLDLDLNAPIDRSREETYLPAALQHCTCCESYYHTTTTTTYRLESALVFANKINKEEEKNERNGLAFALWVDCRR
jgi:hypothetical protein